MLWLFPALVHAEADDDRGGVGVEEHLEAVRRVVEAYHTEAYVIVAAGPQGVDRLGESPRRDSTLAGAIDASAKVEREEYGRWLRSLSYPESGAGQYRVSARRERFTVVIEQLSKTITVNIAQCIEHANLLAPSLTLITPGRGRVASERRPSAAVQQPLVGRVGARLTDFTHRSGRDTTALPHKEKSAYHRRPARRVPGAHPRSKVRVTARAAERKSSSCRPHPSRLPPPDSSWRAVIRWVVDSNHVRADVAWVCPGWPAMSAPTAAEWRPDPLLTIDDVAAWLGKPKNTLYAWHSRGKGPRAIRVGNTLRYRRSEVERWLDAHTDPER